MTIEEIMEEYGVVFDSLDFKTLPGTTKEEVLERFRRDRCIFVPEPKRVDCESSGSGEAQMFGIGG